VKLLLPALREERKSSTIDRLEEDEEQEEGRGEHSWRRRRELAVKG